MAGFRGLFVRAGTVGTQPAEARKSLAGLLVPSSVVGARVGILAGPGNPLRVSGTASWQYTVNAGHVVTSRSDSDGAVVFGLDGTTLTPAVSAAPGSGSRYDLIYLVQHDLDNGDTDANAVLGVVEGVASGAPVKPAVPAGAVVVAEALMAAGATSTGHANVTITQVLGSTVARGAAVPVNSNAERGSLATYPGLRVTRLDRLGEQEKWDGTRWVGEVAWIRMHSTSAQAFGAGVYTTMNWAEHLRKGDPAAFTTGTGFVKVTAPGLYTVAANISLSGARPEAKLFTGTGKVLARGAGAVDDGIVSIFAEDYLPANTQVSLAIFNFAGSGTIPADTDATPNYFTISRKNA